MCSPRIYTILTLKACPIKNGSPLHRPRAFRVSQLGFLGGRLAIRRALNGMKGASAAAASLAILHNQEGAPLLPDGVSASISHKRHMAVALVQPGCDGHIGKPRVPNRPRLKGGQFEAVDTRHPTE